MIDDFGFNQWKKKPYPQCKECHEKGLNFARRDRYVRIETACDFVTCDTRVSGFRDMQIDFGFQPRPLPGARWKEPHSLCRTCRLVGNPNAKMEDMAEGLYIEDYVKEGFKFARSFVLTGPTAPYNDLLNDMGGRWIKKFKDREGSGWSFPMTKKLAVISMLQRRRNVFEEQPEEETDEEDPLPEGACPDCRGETEDRETYLICVKCNKLTMK